MKEEEKKAFYRDLDLYTVSVSSSRKRNRTETYYKFGIYIIEFIRYDKESPNTYSGHVQVYTFNNKKLGFWNQTRPDFQDIHDMYIAVKNKSEGKTYKNPYKDTVITVDEMTACFVKFLTTYTGIFPSDMPTEKRDATIKDLESVYKQHMINYYAGLGNILNDRVKSDR